MLEGVPGGIWRPWGTPKGELRHSMSCSLCVGFRHEFPAFCLFALLEGW